MVFTFEHIKSADGMDKSDNEVAHRAIASLEAEYADMLSAITMLDRILVLRDPNETSIPPSSRVEVFEGTRLR